MLFCLARRFTLLVLAVRIGCWVRAVCSDYSCRAENLLCFALLMTNTCEIFVTTRAESTFAYQILQGYKGQDDFKNLLHMNIIIEENEHTYTFSI